LLLAILLLLTILLVLAVIILLAVLPLLALHFLLALLLFLVVLLLLFFAVLTLLLFVRVLTLVPTILLFALVALLRVLGQLRGIGLFRGALPLAWHVLLVDTRVALALHLRIANTVRAVRVQALLDLFVGQQARLNELAHVRNVLLHRLATAWTGADVLWCACNLSRT